MELLDQLMLLGHHRRVVGLFFGLAWCVCLFGRCDAFNLDLSGAVTHHGQEGSMFGFTVLQYSDQGKQSLLVGAPEAQTAQPDVIKGGAVFRCSITQPDICEELIFDAKGSNTAWNPQTRFQEAYDDKSHQWFGATLITSGPDGAVAACAPRYVYFSPNFAKREPVGTCYVATESLTNFQERSPCRSGAGSSGYHQQGSCQAGFSSAISRDGSRLFVGAPGTWYWQGQAHSTSLKEPEDLLSTIEGPPSTDDSYLGYSMVVGEFNGDRIEDVAVGMPRGYNLTGAVILFDRQLRNLLNLSGEQMGSYFGYSLAVGDINNDKLDDLIVGAPLFTNFSANDNSFEKGRVYVYYQKVTRQFSRPDVLDGEFNRGRLGMSVASVGDLNLDSYGDIAVGAPYAGEDGKGIVYVYMGSKNGIITKAMQAIKASDLDFQLSTFGFSLSGGADLDGNQYPDLVVGAYKSDRAVVLKSRPVVVVTALLDMPTTINLEQKGNCVLKNGTQVSCFVLNTFVSYTGVNVPDQMAIEVETILDSGSHSPRAFFRTHEGQSRMNTTFELARNQQRNSSVYVYIPNQFRDKLNPIKMEAKYRILESPASRQRRDTKPVLDQLNSTSVVRQIRIGNKCGSDNICYPSLRLSARESSGMKEYVLGKPEPLTFDVEVSNDGEDSFETMFFLNLPPGVNYIKTQAQPGPGQQNVAITCTHRGSGSRGGSDENVVICDIANPLPTGQNAKFKIFLAPVAAQMTLDTLNFSAKINSSNPERSHDLRNNQVDFRLNIFAQANLQVSGTSFTNQVQYCVDCPTPSAFTEELQIGPEVKHAYYIYNKGPSPVEAAQVRIIWPTHTKRNMHLLYLMEDPLVEGNAKCAKIKTNLKDIAIEKNLSLSYAPRKQQGVEIAATSLGAGSARRQRHIDQLDLLSDDFEQHFFATPREKRQSDASDLARVKWADPQQACGAAAECSSILCDISRLTVGEAVTITIRSRLWEESLRTLQFSKTNISSTASVHVQTLAHGMRPRSNQYYAAVVKTEVVPSTPALVKAGIEWWMILVGVLLGLLLLVLIILACWKCGYFKRKRPGVVGAAGAPITRSPPPSTNGRSQAGGNGNTPYYAYRYDYADNKYYPERAPGDAYL